MEVAEVELSEVTRREIPVPHVSQCYHWDCGLACACMVLKYYGVPSDQVYTKVLDLLQCGESVWTIDLAYIMQIHGIPHQFCTRTLGVDQAYSKKAYYRQNFNQDENRVTRMFEEAEHKGVVVTKKTLTVEEIVDHLRGNNVAIVLVDWNNMKCLWCNKFRQCLCCLDFCCTAFQGHYVVLCGFDTKQEHIYFKDPSMDKEEMCCSRIDQFDKARKISGTDEDILLLFDKSR